jgi:RNA polymerase sigma-70 factor (ECF subfamily)
MSAGPATEGLDLGALFEEHFDYVWNTLRRLGVREADLEDLVHDVFLKLHTHRGDYDASRPFRPWAFGFAYRVAADHRRLARHRVEVLGATTEPVDPGRSPDQRLETSEQWRLLHEALDAVEVERRAVMLLHDVDGETAPHIAEALGIPVNTVYSRLRLAREEFAAAVRRLRSTYAARGAP